MDKNYMKEYIEFSNEFRKSNGSKESLEKMYDLLYELESLERTKDDNLVLSNVYILLGFHKSAYEVFKEVADEKNSKDASKLYVLEQKAKSHANNFIIKDLRKYREKQHLSKLTLNDFLVIKEENRIQLKVEANKAVIFNKIKIGEISIYIPDNDFTSYSEKIIDHIYWLGDCKEELIQFYNANNDFTNQIADDDWYDDLEIYKMQLTINSSGNMETLISVGDHFSQDHILDIELKNKTIVSMNYDG
nr:hypothetical protein [uncultured Flavobacterium sp.]